MISSPAGKSLRARSPISRGKVFSAVSETTMALNFCGNGMLKLLAENFFFPAVPNVEANCQARQINDSAAVGQDPHLIRDDKKKIYRVISRASREIFLWSEYST